jgi:hypothetical protein
VSKVASREALYAEIAIDVALLIVAIPFHWWLLAVLAVVYLSWDLRSLVAVGFTAKDDIKN